MKMTLQISPFLESIFPGWKSRFIEIEAYHAFTTIAFAAVLASLIPLPWVVLIPNTQAAFTGVDLIFGGYTVPATSNYVRVLAVLAVVGAVMPYIMRRNRTLTRVYLALAGVICTVLMQLHLPSGYPDVQWGPSYYTATSAFFVAALISMYTLGRVQK